MVGDAVDAECESHDMEPESQKWFEPDTIGSFAHGLRAVDFDACIRKSRLFQTFARHAETRGA